MLIEREVLNHMDEDELRNYICYLSKVNNIMGDLNFARSQLVDALQVAYNQKDYELECLSRLNAAQGNVARIVDEMYKKYDEFLPKCVSEE